MKNVQVIDGALNSIFEVYRIPDDLYERVFPDNTDVVFIDDVEDRLRSGGDDHVWDLFYRKRAAKKKIHGIHGTLHLTGSNCSKEFFPTRKEAEVLS